MYQACLTHEVQIFTHEAFSMSSGKEKSTRPVKLNSNSKQNLPLGEKLQELENENGRA
jgi:hypothetical protein